MLLLARLRLEFFPSIFRDRNLDSVVRISQGSNSYYRFATTRVQNIVKKKQRNWRIGILSVIYFLDTTRFVV